MKMGKPLSFIIHVLSILFTGFLLVSFLDKEPEAKPHFRFPYKAAGLNEREAAAHLISRFTFGAKPGEIDEVVNMGLEKWFERQLEGGIADDSLNRRLSSYDAIGLSNSEILNKFPKGFQVLKMAIADGVVNKDSVKTDKQEYKDIIAAYMKRKDIKPEQELFRQFINQKILRASYSNNELREVLTDFWFNHFNVSITKNDCAQFIPAYERDVIRPNVTGKFSELLLATAKSPAMLLYLDNFTSAGFNSSIDNQGLPLISNQESAQNNSNDSSKQAIVLKKIQNARKNQGLNENYAREVMELHTLGVDGGYTQNDVTQAARVLTGWTIYPIGNNGYSIAIKKLIDKVGEENLIKRGFVHDGDFMFAINRHDNNSKTILGETFSANSGYQEGVDLLNMLAHHQSTAKFISKKLATRFVSDNPPQSLIDKMAKTFIAKDGDIKEVLITMVTSPEFWNKSYIRSKTKSPFELTVSAIRSLNADIQQPYQLFIWDDRMGEKIYFYQAPTGFPDNGQYWINTGALLNRMNFGLAVASERIPGIKVNLLALNNNHEPESANAALVKYGNLIMPERDLSETVKRLTPFLNDPSLIKKVDAAAGKNKLQSNSTLSSSLDNLSHIDMNMEVNQNKETKDIKKSNAIIQYQGGNNNMLSQVVGIIIGSPEFQRK